MNPDNPMECRHGISNWQWCTVCLEQRTVKVVRLYDADDPEFRAKQVLRETRRLRRVRRLRQKMMSPRRIKWIHRPLVVEPSDLL